MNPDKTKRSKIILAYFTSRQKIYVVTSGLLIPVYGLGSLTMVTDYGQVTPNNTRYRHNRKRERVNGKKKKKSNKGSATAL